MNVAAAVLRLSELCARPMRVRAAIRLPLINSRRAFDPASIGRWGQALNVLQQPQTDKQTVCWKTRLVQVTARDQMPPPYLGCASVQPADKCSGDTLALGWRLGCCAGGKGWPGRVMTLLL